MARRLHVYLPPGYDPRRRTRYPVLYLLHGHGDDDSEWTQSSGSANFILDNLIADHKAQPMIVVMPYGMMPANLGGSSVFAHEVLHEIIPLIQSQYLTKNDANDRAVAGLSMGGSQARQLGLGADAGDIFAYVGMFSPGGGAGDPISAGDADRLNSRLKLVWLSVGNGDSIVGSGPRQLDAWLTANHVNHDFQLYIGDHVWNVWRRSLIDFAPLLFHPARKPSSRAASS
jgi:enterochelin esterase-like enzyme